MAAELKLAVSKLAPPDRGIAVVLADSDLATAPATAALLTPVGRPAQARRGGRRFSRQGLCRARHRRAGGAACVAPDRHRARQARGGREDRLGQARRRRSWGACLPSASAATVLLERPAGAIEPAERRRFRPRAAGCAPMPSTATRRGKKDGESGGKVDRGDDRRRGRRRRAEGAEAARRRSPRACFSRAISSTSRRTCSFRPSSPRAPRR